MDWFMWTMVGLFAALTVNVVVGMVIGKPPDDDGPSIYK